MQDLNQLVSEIRSNFPGSSKDIFTLSRSVFKESQFFRVVEPVNHANSIEPSFRQDLEAMALSTLILSLRNTPSEESLDIGILLSILLVMVQHFTSIDKSSPEIPVNIQDLDKLHHISCRYPDYKPLIKKLFPYLHPRIKCHQLYLDRTGSSYLRDNAADSIVRDLSRGEETGRSISVVLDEVSNHVTLVNPRTGKQIVDVEQVLNSALIAEDAKREIRDIVSDLNNIIPAPQGDDAMMSSEEEPATTILDLVPSENMRHLLRTGRVPRRKARKSSSGEVYIS